MRENWRWDTVKDQLHMIRSEERGDYHHLVVGALGKLGNAGSPIASWTVHLPTSTGLVRLFEQAWANQRKPTSTCDGDSLKRLDEEVAELMVAGFGGVMTRQPGARLHGRFHGGPFGQGWY